MAQVMPKAARQFNAFAGRSAGNMVGRFGLRLHCFVLMDNHYHLIVGAAKKLVASPNDALRIDNGGSLSIDTSLLNHESCVSNWEYLRNIVNNTSGKHSKVVCMFINCQFAGLVDSATTSMIVKQHCALAIPRLDDLCHTVYLASKYDSSKDTPVAPIYLMIGESFRDAMIQFVKSDTCSGCTDVWVATCDQIHSSAHVSTR